MLRRSSGAHTRAVVFDLDGTLLDTMTAAQQVYVDTIRFLGGPELSASEIIAAWHTGPTPVVLEHFLGRPVTPCDLDCYYERYEALIATVQPFRGVRAMLDALARQEYALGVFTAATRRAATSALSAARLDGRFAVVVAGDEIHRPKPAADGLLLAYQRLGASAKESIYVGDAAVDLECARAAGARAIHAAWSTSIIQIPGDHVIARQPRDVVRFLVELSMARTPR
jgi:HAD superfamily hydrolase (TIGR01509 family)